METKNNVITKDYSDNKKIIEEFRKMKPVKIQDVNPKDIFAVFFWRCESRCSSGITNVYWEGICPFEQSNENYITNPQPNLYLVQGFHGVTVSFCWDDLYKTVDKYASAIFDVNPKKGPFKFFHVDSPESIKKRDELADKITPEPNTWPDDFNYLSNIYNFEINATLNTKGNPKANFVRKDAEVFCLYK